MLLLAADTSGKLGSIALARCDGDRCGVIEVIPLAGGTFSAQLVPQIAALLRKHSFGKQDIGGFAVVSGPGSFTGLRVGLAAIKGLAEVLEKPIAAVSLLEAVAIAGGTRGRVIAALDAGRSEAYLGEYEVQASAARLMGERLVPFTELPDAKATLVTPDPSVAEAARTKGIRVEEVTRPDSGAIARMGWKRIVSGLTVSPEALEANYIRRSDAEIFSKPETSS
jgi:tRNA threonylcarbamoyladenosine biosynthesis protein TsaB